MPTYDSEDKYAHRACPIFVPLYFGLIKKILSYFPLPLLSGLGPSALDNIVLARHLYYLYHLSSVGIDFHSKLTHQPSRSTIASLNIFGGDAPNRTAVLLASDLKILTCLSGSFWSRARKDSLFRTGVAPVSIHSPAPSAVNGAVLFQGLRSTHAAFPVNDYAAAEK